ncbi:hypothetical protein ACFX11_022921 [Malus domestica]
MCFSICCSQCQILSNWGKGPTDFHWIHLAHYKAFKIYVKLKVSSSLKLMRGLQFVQGKCIEYKKPNKKIIIKSGWSFRILVILRVDEVGDAGGGDGEGEGTDGEGYDIGEFKPEGTIECFQKV